MKLRLLNLLAVKYVENKYDLIFADFFTTILFYFFCCLEKLLVFQFTDIFLIDITLK